MNLHTMHSASFWHKMATTSVVTFSFLVVLAALFMALIMPNGMAQAASEGCKDSNPETPCDVFDSACQQASQSEFCRSNQGEQSPRNNSIYGPDGIITKATGLIALLSAIVAVIVIIISGLQYILSTGDSAKVNQSKNAILFAVIGLVVAALAQIIVIFVLRRL